MTNEHIPAITCLHTTKEFQPQNVISHNSFISGFFIQTEKSRVVNYFGSLFFEQESALHTSIECQWGNLKVLGHCLHGYGFSQV
jgi:hypothetical protein